MATIYGEKVKFGMTELSGVLINSADLSLAMEVKEYANEVGETVSLVKYKHRVEGSITATMLQTTSEAAVQTAVETWLAAVATAAPFSLAAGGTVVVSEFKVSEQNEDAATLSITATYYPDVDASA